MPQQQFRNRHGNVVSARTASAPKRVQRGWKKPLLIVGGLVFLGLYMQGRTSAETPPAAATTPPATVTVKQPQRAKFPDVDETELTSTQQRILRLARAEYAKNPQSYDKTVLKYSEGFEESWCADFISWVRSEAGAPYQHSTTGYWRIPGVKTLQDYYRTYDAYFAVGDYTPKLGDVAFYEGETPDGSNSEHVAMVLAVEGDMLVTIGGNETNDGILQIRKNKLALGERGLVGFGRSAL